MVSCCDSVAHPDQSFNEVYKHFRLESGPKPTKEELLVHVPSTSMPSWSNIMKDYKDKVTGLDIEVQFEFIHFRIC